MTDDRGTDGSLRSTPAKGTIHIAFTGATPRAVSRFLQHAYASASSRADGANGEIRLYEVPGLLLLVSGDLDHEG
jgi:hypothetical protein